jgi:hypothetical protein
LALSKSGTLLHLSSATPISSTSLVSTSRGPIDVTLTEKARNISSEETLAQELMEPILVRNLRIDGLPDTYGEDWAHPIWIGFTKEFQEQVDS